MSINKLRAKLRKQAIPFVADLASRPQLTPEEAISLETARNLIKLIAEDGSLERKRRGKK